MADCKTCPSVFCALASFQDPSLRLNTTYYLTRQLVPSLNRVFGLLGVDTMQWYQELPRWHRISSHHQPGTPGKKVGHSKPLLLTGHGRHRVNRAQCHGAAKQKKRLLSTKVNLLNQICFAKFGLLTKISCDTVFVGFVWFSARFC